MPSDESRLTIPLGYPRIGPGNLGRDEIPFFLR